MAGPDLQDYRVHEVSPDLRVRVTADMPGLPADLDELVERLWQAAAARVIAAGGPALFNGCVFSADVIKPSLISGHMTEFRRVVAQMQEPALFAALGIRPLAVCGILHCGDGIVVGRRSSSALYQAAMWQLPPAGSVDGSAEGSGGWMDLEAQLLTELREELGLARDAVSLPEALCVVEHPGSHVSDLGMVITANVDMATVLAAHASRGNAEYDPLRVVALSELADFVEEVGALLVPSAAIYLRRLGYTS